MLTTARVFTLALGLSAAGTVAIGVGIDSTAIRISAEDAIQNLRLDVVDKRLDVLEQKSDRNLEAVHVNSLLLASLQSETRVWFEILSAIIAAGIGTLAYMAKRIIDATSFNKSTLHRMTKNNRDEENDE
jgi:hypothetical protein